MQSHSGTVNGQESLLAWRRLWWLDTPNRQSSMEIEAAIKSLEEKAVSTLVPQESSANSIAT